MKWSHLFLGGFAILLIVGGLGALVCGMITSITMSHDRQQSVAACGRVLECLDLGVGRTECAKLFPGCSQKDDGS